MRWRDEDRPIKIYLNLSEFNTPYLPGTNPDYDTDVAEAKNAVDEWNNRFQEYTRLLTNNRKDFPLFTYKNPDGSMIDADPEIGNMCHWHADDAGAEFITHFDSGVNNEYNLHTSTFISQITRPIYVYHGQTIYSLRRVFQHELGVCRT